jgi:hydrogenase nickel incorporation protein HypB
VKVVNLQSGQSVIVGHDHSPDHSHPHDHFHPDDHSHEHNQSHSHDHSHPDDHTHEHDHSHPHDHSHEQDHSHAQGQSHDHKSDSASEHSSKISSGSTVISLEERVLAKNDKLAERNRGWFEGSNILALNFVSSPGAGKTALLERTIKDLQTVLSISVIEGDQATLNDAERIKKTGCKVIQINTGAGCHLDAEMVSAGLKQLTPPRDSVVFIENVGNLVCPALFDLGEKCKVAILSITEGEDKPVKYPHMFRAAEILLLNKMDLLPHLDFDIESCKRFALSVNPKIKIFEISALRGNGLDAWYEWIKEQVLSPQLR